jgi:hypothetical protein
MKTITVTGESEIDGEITLRQERITTSSVSSIKEGRRVVISDEMVKAGEWGLIELVLR